MQPASSELASRALALLDTWDARPIDGGPKLADRGDIPNSYPVIGAPNQHSPAGAVGDWYLTLDRLPGENPELAPVSMRVTLFDDDVDASGHAASILGEDHEPLAADANGGIVPMGDGGLFATVRGPWYFEIVNTSLGEINREPDPTTTPIDLLRRVATSWVEQINASGLG